MGVPLKVLIVDDSEDDAKLILRELRRAAFDTDSERVDTAEDLRAALGRKAWQVIICDHSMPRFDSFSALEIVKDHDIELPFIVVSGAIVDDTAVKTMKAGAHDYLMKDNLARLVPAIERELRDKEGRRQRKKAEQSLAEQSSLLNTTFENMDQGFVVFDTDRTLVAFNQRYVELLEYPAGYIQLGRSFEEIIRFNAERGLYGAGSAEKYVNEHLNSLGKKELFLSEINRADGAVISIRRRPMPDGGFVSTFTDNTERKRAEEKANNSVALLQAGLENMGHGLCVFDADHKVVAYNKPYLYMARLPDGLDPMGLGYEQVLRHRVAQGVFDEEELQRRLKLIEDDSKPEIRERIHPDGFVFVYQRRPMPGGGFILTYTDITERKRAEVKVAEKSALLETTLDNMAQGFCVYDANQKLVAYNKEYIEMAGFPPDFIHLGIDRRKSVRFLAEQGTYGKGDIDELVEDRMTSVWTEDGQHLDRHRPNGKHYIFTRKLMPDGGFVGTYTDITERKLAEEELAVKSALLETTLKSMGNGYCVYDADFRLVAFNRVYEDIYKFPPGFLRIGLPFKDLMVYLAKLGVFGEGDIEKLVKSRIESAMLGEERINEVALPDGTSCLYHRRPMPNGGFVATHTDITERRRAENKIRELNETLEEKVEERTAELEAAQEGLLRAERLATLGQLTGTVAHELRNPLGAVSATAKTIEHTISDAGLGLTKMFARMDRGIRRCDNIITELLDFARAKGLEVEPTPLDSWVSQTLDEITIPQGITLHHAFDATGVVAQFDRDRLRRALINVVDNACQAMGGDDGELRVATGAVDERVEITITDTGPGIPKDVMAKIFEPLFSTKQFGVGLGLPTVRQIMEEHGGGFEITNGESVGTRATLWLPLAASVAEDIRTSA